MALALVGEAAVGPIFELLLKRVTDGIREVTGFSSDLRRLKSTLELIKPAVDEIERLNRISVRPPRETEIFTNQLKEVEKLVRKCSQVEKWKVWKRSQYSRKMKKLEISLLRFFQMDVAVLHFTETKRNSVVIAGVEEKVNRIEAAKAITVGGGNLTGFPGWSRVPDEPEFVVGLEQPLQELRTILLADGGNVVVVYAPRGCGKTTLAIKLCHDEQIKGLFGDNIFFVTVSKTPNLNLIVQKIFQTIDNSQVPDFQDDEDPTSHLEQVFSRHIGQNPILLVLDDVWSGPLPAEYLIQKFVFRRPQYKILATSRFESPRFYTYRLKLLSNQASVELLIHWAFKEGICFVSNDLLNEAVRACGGFPLAIEVLGKTLYGDPEAAWLSRFCKCSSCKPDPFIYRICAGCNGEIGHGRYLSCMGAVWHPECFRCHACNLPISDIEFSLSDDRPYHKSCYKELYHPKCDVCKNFIPRNSAGLIEYRAHPFWLQKYCPSHELDGTPRCCSCERLKPVDASYLVLDDGRELCLECLDSSIMDIHECQALYLEVQDFYEGLNLKIEQEVPLLLVGTQVLNEDMGRNRNGYHLMPVTRGLIQPEEATVSMILRWLRTGGHKVMDMFGGAHILRRLRIGGDQFADMFGEHLGRAIILLYGFPRLLTGSILAHLMITTWFRHKGYPDLRPDVQNGISQVLAHMWLESVQTLGSVGSSSNDDSSSASSSSISSSSQSEKNLLDFFKYQIENDIIAKYGFRRGREAVLKYGLKFTLDHICLTGSFPC